MSSFGTKDNMILKSREKEELKNLSSDSDSVYSYGKNFSEEEEKRERVKKLNELNQFFEEKTKQLKDKSKADLKIKDHGIEVVINDSDSEYIEYNYGYEEPEEDSDNGEYSDQIKVEKEIIKDEPIKPVDQYMTLEDYDPNDLFNQISSDMEDTDNHKNRKAKDDKKEEYKSSLFTSFFALIRIKLFRRKKVEPIEVIDVNQPKTVKAFNGSEESLKCFSIWKRTRSKTL